MHKGPDRAMISMTAYNDQCPSNVYEWDEIQHYKSVSVVTPPEAVSKILSMPLWERSVSVQVLPVHGPGEERVYFEEGAEEEALANVQSTKLQGFFALCANDPSLDIHYADVPAHFMWEKDRETGERVWRAKKEPTDAIGRLAQASPSPNSERYYVRLLLLNRRRLVKSWEYANKPVRKHYPINIICVDYVDAF